MNYRKYTPLIIVLALLELILILITVNYLFINNKNGNSLGGIIALIGVLLNLVIIAIERAIVSNQIINIKLIWIIEILVIIISTIYVYYNGISIG